MTETPQGQVPEAPNALRLAAGLCEAIPGFPAPTALENAAALELRRLHAENVALRAELAKEAARTASEKLRADQMTEQHRMQAAMNTEARAQLASIGASHGQAPAQTDSVLYDPKAVLDVFNSARAGSEKPVGYMRGIRAVIAHWESRPEPHRWMVPAQADSVQEDAARYRLLRRGQHWSVIDGIGNDLRAEALDAAVDAGRKQGATP